MTGGDFTSRTNFGGNFDAKITPVVVASAFMAATGGLMFGYNVGVSGGLRMMQPFLRKFFQGDEKGQSDNYCQNESRGLQLFTPSLYLAGMAATIAAAYTTRKFGRRMSMLLGGIFSLCGAAFSAAAQGLPMLIIGRLLLGCGAGFGNQAVPVFLSEIAPTRLRGAMNILFQLNVTIGIFFASLVNYGTSKIKGDWGWRVSLGMSGVPALLLTAAALLVADTPNSLIERGHVEEGKEVLRKIRGADNVESEFMELVEASQVANQVNHPFTDLFIRRNQPRLIIAVALQIFQQFTGINVIMFYAPLLFKTLGFKNDAPLYSAVITVAVNFLSTLISIYAVDKVGRRMLLLEAGVQMFLSQLVIAVILGINARDQPADLSKGLAVFVLVMVCTFVSSFAWSWGPLGWLIPSETFPLGSRSAGQSVTVFTNFLFTFVIVRSYLAMLCHLRYGMFLFFSVWVLVMSLFVMVLLPETMNVPIEDLTDRVWKQHKVWKRFVE